MKLIVDEEDADGNSVHVLQVKRGSAVYPCLLDTKVDVRKSLKTVGHVLENPDSESLTLKMLKPLDALSKVASKLNCEIRLEEPSSKQPLAVISGNSYGRIRGSALTFDEATVHGYLLRVGGATERRCALRVHGRDKLLYCVVDTPELSRELGKHLYEPVTVTGRGLFFSRTWDLVELSITRATYTTLNDFESSIQALRDAGGDAWDSVVDVDAELRGMR